MALVKYNDNSISAISSAGQLATGSLVPIKTLTASSSSTLSFVHGSNDVVLDSTYPIYKFEFINLHPSTNAIFRFNLSTDSGSNYNVTKTSTNFRQLHRENDTETGLGYNTAEDLAQSTSDCSISSTVATNSDDNLGGTLYLFNPSSTTFVKHFMANTNVVHPDPASYNDFTAGYGNTTSAVNGIKFNFASGNIDSGTIKLYGIKGD